MYYYNNNWQVLCEADSDGVIQRSFVYGNYIDEVLIMRTGSTLFDIYYYRHDHLHSPVALTEVTGYDVLERYEYDAYGDCNILEDDYSRDADQKSDYENPYLFTGRRVDILDNGNLKIMYYRHRYYDTYTGRFLQHDLHGYADGMNLYEYVASNPLVRLDPRGTAWEGPTICLPNSKETEEALSRLRERYSRYIREFEYGQGTVDRPYKTVREGEIVPKAVTIIKTLEFEKLLNGKRNILSCEFCSEWHCLAKFKSNKSFWSGASRKRLDSIIQAQPLPDPIANPIDGILTIHMSWDIYFEKEYISLYRFRGWAECKHHCFTGMKGLGWKEYKKTKLLYRDKFYVAEKKKEVVDRGIIEGEYYRQQTEDTCFGK